MGPRIIREHKPSMVHSKFCGLQSFNSKKILLALGVIAWAAIFFLSGTLFIRRRYESTNEVGRTSYVTFCKFLSPLLQWVRYLLSIHVSTLFIFKNHLWEKMWNCCMRFTEIVAPCGLLNDIHFEIVNTVEALAFLVFAQMQKYFIDKTLGENNNEFAFFNNMTRAAMLVDKTIIFLAEFTSSLNKRRSTTPRSG